jgi:hypothetical protein
MGRRRGVLGGFVSVFGSDLLFVLPVYSLKGMGSFLPRYILVVLMLCFSFFGVTGSENNRGVLGSRGLWCSN